MIVENNIQEVKLGFNSSIWYGNPQNELIEGTLTGTQTIYQIPSVLDFKEEELDQIKQYIWDMNIKNTYIHSSELCCTNVKNKFFINEYIQSISSYLSYVNYIRVLKSPNPNVYYIYLKFKNVEFCNIFYNTFSYSKINPVENEFMIFAEIENMKLDEIDINKKTGTNNSTNSNSHFIVKGGVSINCNSSNNGNNNGGYKQIESGITHSIEEQKDCSICLDILEKANININSSSGIIYVLCGHAFHIECLSKLDDDKCPLCRYYLSPACESSCELCSCDKDLWMCLVCGRISCGEEGGGTNHRFEHYKCTGHVYAQGIGEKHNFIFDFSKNSPVHVWIHNSILKCVNDKEDFDYFKNPKEKVEYIMSEYNSIISSQLESQKYFYLEKMHKMENDYLLKQKHFEVEMIDNQEKLESIEKALKESEHKKKEALELAKLKNNQINKISIELKNSEEEYNCLIKEKNKYEEIQQKRINTIEELISKEDEEINELILQLKEFKLNVETMKQIEKRNDYEDIKKASLGGLLEYKDTSKTNMKNQKGKR